MPKNQKLTNKAYVIMESGFEYNDEINSRYQDGGGIPVKIYHCMKEAEDDVTRRYKQRITKDFSFSDYCYDISDLCSDPRKDVCTIFNNIVSEVDKVNPGDDGAAYEISTELTEAQIDALLDLFDRLCLFYIQEVEEE